MRDIFLGIYASVVKPQRYNSNKSAQEQVHPTINIETEVVRFEGKHFLVSSVAETPSVKKSRARLSQDEPREVTKIVC